MSAVPDDFPRDPFPASLGGAQPKIVGRLINGRLVVGLTEAERAERYAMCVDLVAQLVLYCQRKHREQPTRTAEQLLAWVGRGVRAKQGVWHLGATEIDWILERLRGAYHHASGCGETEESGIS